MAGSDYPSVKRQGFTLLEMMIVLFLISLIMGLSALHFAGAMPSVKLGAAVRDLSATIRHARTLAMIDGKLRTLNIDLDAKRYGIEGLGYKSIDPGITIMVLDPFAGEVRSGIYHLIFQASGGVQGCTIILGSGKKEISIGLDPIVGSVVIK